MNHNSSSLIQIVGFIVVGCVTGVGGAGPFVGVLGGQTYVLVVACVCIIITFVILIVYLFGFHLHLMQAFPWRIFVSRTFTVTLFT